MREEKLPLRITVLKHTFLFNPKLNIVKKTSVCSVVYCMDESNSIRVAAVLEGGNVLRTLQKCIGP